MSSMDISSGNYFCRLKSLGVIQLTGEQADSYLQGQVSVNVGLLTATHALLACHCDFKGKLWNANYLIRHQQQIDFLVKDSAQPSCLAELKKYGVFSKVDIVDADDSHTLIGVVGEAAKSKLLSVFPELSGEHRSVVSNQDGWILTLNSAKQARYLCRLTNDSAILQTITGSIEEQPESVWDVLDITDGITPIFAATSNEFVPQMLNMQALQAIDFNKGCYMGQEVVARTKYLGKNKRATYLLTGNVESSSEIVNVLPGDMLEMAVGENWRRGGTIVHASQHQGVVYVLAVLNNDSQIGDVLRLKASPEISLTIAELPYAV